MHSVTLPPSGRVAVEFQTASDPFDATRGADRVPERLASPSWAEAHTQLSEWLSSLSELRRHCVFGRRCHELPVSVVALVPRGAEGRLPGRVGRRAAVGRSEV